MKEITLKIGRHTYKVTQDDTFMDNGACVTLTSQSLERSSWGHQSDPVLSKRAIKEISKFNRIQLQHGYGERVQIFSLDTSKIS
jgi:hypothetical protein